MRLPFCRHCCIALLLIILAAVPSSLWAQGRPGATSYEKAIQAMRSGDLGIALDHMQQAVMEYPENLEIQYGLGVVYQQLGRIDEAETIFRELVRQDEGKFRTAYFLLAKIAQDRGKDDEALGYLKKARTADPGRADFQSGLIYMVKKDYSRAAELFRSARTAKRELAAEAMIYEAAALAQLRKFDDARKILQSAQKEKTTPQQSDLIRKMLVDVEAAKRGVKRWHFSGFLGFQHDNNVTQSAFEFASAAGGNGRKDDFAQFTSITGRYDVYRNDPWVAGVGYNHYNLTYFDHPDLSNVAARPTVYAYWNKAPFFVGLEYLYSHYWEDMKNRADIHSIFPVFAVGGEKWRTELRSWSEWREFHDGSPDDTTFGTGVLQYYLMKKGLAHIRAGFNVSVDQTIPRDAGSYHETQYVLGMQFPVWKDKWFLDVSGYYTDRTFRLSPFFAVDQRRRDNAQDLYAILRGPLPGTDDIQILLIYQRSWNDSNIIQTGASASGDPFNFTRDIFSCMLAFEY